jgi:hypothetical protein
MHTKLPGLAAAPGEFPLCRKPHSTDLFINLSEMGQNSLEATDRDVLGTLIEQVGQLWVHCRLEYWGFEQYLWLKG